MADFMFFTFAGIAVFGGLMVAFHRNVVHSVFGLVAALFGVGGLYWTLGADFLGATQILLYVGGVTVLLLFAVMLTTSDASRVTLLRTLIMVPIVGFLALKVLEAYRGVSSIVNDTGHVVVDAPAGSGTTPEIGNLFVSPEGYLLPFEVAAVLLLVVLVGAVTVARQRDDVAAEEGRGPGGSKPTDDGAREEDAVHA